MLNTSVVITERVSDDRRKTAVVFMESGKYFVQLKLDGKLIETRDLSNYSLYYAEDLAENYVSGVLNLVEIND